MKSIIIALTTAIVLATAGLAQASFDAFDLDLTGQGGGVSNDIFQLNVSGAANVIQMLTGPGGDLANGDAFTEVVTLQSDDFNALGIPFPAQDLDLPADQELIFFAELSGVVSNVSGSVFDGTAAFTLNFQSGTLLDGIYLADPNTFDPNVDTKLADAIFQDASGNVNDFVVGGQDNGATTFLFCLELLFDDMFFADLDMDGLLEDLANDLPINEAVVAVVSTNNNIISIDSGTPGQVDLVITSGGQVEVDTKKVVPEPATMFLIGAGFLGLGARARRKLQK